ncbi:MAG TPA: ABC transporter ATP-binding protein [Dissulfurispiraceae bacterium]|nr:ABC transporter ATP-binding protein [Dissulfurispiraceae bacterium]
MRVEEIFNKKTGGTSRDDLAIFWYLSEPYIPRLLAAMICSLVISGISGALAWGTKFAVDDVLISKNAVYLISLAIGTVALFMLKGIFAFCNNYLMASIGAKIVRVIRQEVYEKVLSLPISFHSQTSSGDVVSKMLNDVGILQNTVGFTIKDFIVETGTVIVLAGVAVYRRWDLAILSFVVVPMMVFSIARLGKRMKKTGMRTRELIARITTVFNETVQGVKIIKAFTMERAMTARNERAQAEYYRNSMREVRINEGSALIGEILAGVGIALIIFYGFSLVVSSMMSPGDFTSFIVAVGLMYNPLKRLSRVHNNFQSGRNVIDRLRIIMTSDAEKIIGEELDVKGDIVFDNVSFRYPTASGNAIQNVNLAVHHGNIVALVGYSGAGKSTLVDIIAGFWYPSEGQVFIDGRDIRNLSLRSLRSHIGTVTQDIMLFDDTVKENIRFGRPGATDEEVMEAARAAFAHEFIMDMPKGYDTMIGERGVRISGGQKQRITIARAIIRNPSILILDEATSSLDTESEHQVQKALERLMQNRTTIVIAHRLSTVQNASRIVVMSGGGIIQEGTHEELIAQGGLYQELYNMQFMSNESKQEIGT